MARRTSKKGVAETRVEDRAVAEDKELDQGQGGGRNARGRCGS